MTSNERYERRRRRIYQAGEVLIAITAVIGGGVAGDWIATFLGLSGEIAYGLVLFGLILVIWTLGNRTFSPLRKPGEPIKGPEL